MGYIILLLVIAVLYGLQRAAAGVANAMVNKALGVRRLQPAEPDWLCLYCPQRWHDGGKRCTKCGGATSSTGYAICHTCAGKGAPLLPNCESCGRPC